MYKSESIILSKMPLKESDLLVRFFSLNDGKISGVARNARKSKKRFGGVLETGYIVEFSYFRRGSSDLYVIDDAKLLVPKTYKEKSLSSSTALWLGMELASKFLPDGEAGEQKFALLKRFVTAIHEGRLTRQILVFFLFRWVGLAGYMPDLGDTVESDDFKFRHCFREGTAPLLKRIVSGDVDCDISAEAFGDALMFIFGYVTRILGKPLNIEEYYPILLEL